MRLVKRSAYLAPKLPERFEMSLNRLADVWSSYLPGSGRLNSGTRRPAIEVFPERYEAFLNPFEQVYLAERDKRRQPEKERDFGLSDLRP